MARTLIFSIICAICLPSFANGIDTITRLRTEMLKYISTTDRAKFFDVTEQLKDKSLTAGDERTFYTAWGNQAIYEATHQYYTQAYDIAGEIADYAKENHSPFGTYTALHAKAMTDMQKQDYESAEAQFQKAVSYRHKHFPGESAGDDLQELMKIANHRKDAKAGFKYANQILAEPHVAPIHKGRALFRLSQFAFQKNDKDEYNRIYAELQALKKSDGIAAIEPIVEVNYCIINGDYDEALRLCDGLSAEKQAERKSLIYHRLGDNDKAYEYMAKFKQINDSIVLVSHGNVVASCYVQMNNERMKLEQKLLEEENHRLRETVYVTLIVAIIIILTMIILQRQRKVKRLTWDNTALKKAHKETKKQLSVKNEFLNNITNELRAPLNPIMGFSDILGTAEYEMLPEEREELSQHIKDNSGKLIKLIDEMAELSFYESKKSLPITFTTSPNHLARHLIDSLESQCKPGVKIVYETTLSDDMTTATNAEAMTSLLRHLLQNAIQYTEQGTITLSCTEHDGVVRSSVTDTGRGIDRERQQHIFDMFREEGDNLRLNALGLNICKTIVKLLHGRIWLDTEYTEGTRFVFDLPKYQEYR